MTAYCKFKIVNHYICLFSLRSGINERKSKVPSSAVLSSITNNREVMKTLIVAIAYFTDNGGRGASRAVRGEDRD